MNPILFEPVKSPYLVPFDGSFRVQNAPTAPPEGLTKKKANREALEVAAKRLRGLQRKLYADDKPFMRRTVAEILTDTLASLPIDYPKVAPEARREMLELRQSLADE